MTTVSRWHGYIKTTSVSSKMILKPDYTKSKLAINLLKVMSVLNKILNHYISSKK
ncbi:protein of unknown function [Tenacibaculum sp. 190524A02b]